MRRIEGAFTLIEILVVVAIIGVLSSVVLSSLNTARSKAGYAAAKQTMAQIAKAANVAEGESGKTLMQITVNGCSGCSCNTTSDYRNISSSDGCYTAWVAALAKIQAATNGIYGASLAQATRDPWGSPYYLDENEGEIPANPCRIDGLTTMGPDGIRATSDDYSITIPFSGNTPGC